MRRLVALWLAVVSVGWSQPAAERVAFHHLHLTDATSGLIHFYEGLFDRSDVERLTLWGSDALRTGQVLLISSPTQAAATPGPSAIWHYGWGRVSLRETYLAHNLREVAWEPPLPSNQFHFHLDSVLPNTAAAWYRDRLGAEVEFASDSDDTADRDLRRPHALARIGTVTLLFYKSAQPLASTRGKLADHLAFTVPDLATMLARIVAADTTVLETRHALGADSAALIEGPDRLAIELVELDRP